MCLQEAEGDAEEDGVGLPAQAPPQAPQSSSGEESEGEEGEGEEGEGEEPVGKRLRSRKSAAKKGNKAKVSHSLAMRCSSAESCCAAGAPRP